MTDIGASQEGPIIMSYFFIQNCTVRKSLPRSTFTVCSWSDIRDKLSEWS